MPKGKSKFRLHSRGMARMTPNRLKNEGSQKHKERP